MKFFITYLSGFLSGLLFLANAGKPDTQLFTYIMVGTLFVGSLIFCIKYHKSKSKKFWEKIKDI